MADDDASTIDYLGRRQPLDTQRIGLATGGSGGAGGGAGVTAPAMPSVGQRATAARELLSGGPSTGQEILRDISQAKSIGERLAQLFPSESKNPPGQPGTNPDPFSADANQFGAGIAPSTPDAAELAFLNSPDSGLVAAGAGPAGAADIAAGAAGDIAGAASSALPYLGSALSLSQDLIGDAPALNKGVDAALDVGAAALAPFTFGLSLAGLPLAKAGAGEDIKSIETGNFKKLGFDELALPALGFKAIDDALRAFGLKHTPFDMAFDELFGSGPSHAERESKEANRTLGQAGEFQGAITRAKSPEELFKTLLNEQSPTVGGKSDLSVAVSLPEHAEAFKESVASGDVILPTKYGQDVERFLREHPGDPINLGPGEPNAYYPVFTEQGFFKNLQGDPQGLSARIQAGVNPSMLQQGNRALSNTILQQYGRVQPPQAPPPPQVSLPAEPVQAPGPSGALGFAQDLLDQPGTP